MTTHDQDTYTQPSEGIENPRERTDPVLDPTTNSETGYAESTTPAQQPVPSEAPNRQVQSEWSDGSSADQAQGEAPRADAAEVNSAPSSSEPVQAPTESTAGRALFADDELAGLTARWDSVQAAFVDDPRECVQKADGLVSDVLEQLTSGFSDARARLEEQWARGEEASTEDLRVALKQYREFFQRLLAV
ncbi:MAG: hypothetical protein QOJ80_5668 [Mycobacterium sp.]|jgi:hypothetical protein|nr:hypothetical protein [Mycobacterium sp.]